MFRVVTTDGRMYTSSHVPAVKKGFLYLTDEARNFFSLPLESVDWKATRLANQVLPPQLLDRWEEGPVRYLLSASQSREYRALSTDQQCAAWIARFWAELDRTPGTFHNEVRHEYWSRVRHSNVRFTGSTKPGWKTDRGRIYILLGPPDDIETFAVRSGNEARFDPRYTGDAPAGYPRHTIPPRGVERWSYRNPPGDQLDPNFIVAFREDSSGEYYLSTKPIDYDRIFRDTTANFLSAGGDAGLQRSLVRGNRTGTQRAGTKAEFGRTGQLEVSALSLLGDLGKVQDLALVENWISEVVHTYEYFGNIPLRSAFHFYRSEEGLIYVEINLMAEPGPASGKLERPRRSGSRTSAPLVLAARLVSQDDPSTVIEFPAEDGFAALALRDGSETRWIYQSGAGVPPGSYALLIAITEERTGNVGSWREIVEVPDLSSAQGLVLSDLVLAHSVKKTGRQPRGPYKEPFVHGQLRVVPQIEPVYGSGSEFGFYYQIYGARIDPATGKPDLDLVYRFERLQEDGTALEVSEPVRLEHQQELSQAFSFPLENWPPGSYRLSVEVTDRISGVHARRQEAYRVTP
ncbi:MAG: GWxTD domain-containing protein [Acidobacteriota bacterium]